jgi:peptidoglycan hydrolase-like protein with peptidoglycan-binding domain
MTALLTPTPQPQRNRKTRFAAAAVVAGLFVAPVTISQIVSAAPTQSPNSFNGLAVGARGQAVVEIQAALVNAGIRLVGGVDGNFGPMTAQALREFQTRNGLSATGVIDQATAVALGVASAPALLVRPGLQRNATGSNVADLQRALVNSGIRLIGGVDGVFGPATERALRQFQTERGLEVTGTVTEATANALSGAPAAPQTPVATSLVGLRVGSNGQNVRMVQQSLLNAGITFPGGADGIFGPATANALRVFQSRAGIKVTGEVDEATAALLTGQTLSATPSTPTMTPLLGLAPGARGPQVALLQRTLMADGITVIGGADGVFGPATANAIRQFQSKRGLTGSGVVDAATATALATVEVETAPAPAPAAPVPTTPAPTTPAPEAPAAPAPAPGSFPNLGDRGPQVAELQRALIAAGIPVPGGADGIFGSMTAGAVIAFQRNNGLPVNGVVDAAVASLLGIAPSTGNGSGASNPSAPTVALVHFPVQGRCNFADTWHYPRGGGRLHIGVDIIAPEGNLIYAVTDGTITRMFREGSNSMTGNGFRLTMDDGSGTYFFYAHLKDFAPGIDVGTKVVAGQILGTNGKTGNAGVPHLHFEIHPGGIAPVNPYPFVRAVDGCRTTTVPPQPTSLGQLAAQAALTQLGVAYSFNTALPGVSFDCSGLTTWAWSLAGVRLTRQSQAQFAETTQITASEAQAGDLIFFHDPISHVGLYLGDGRMVHAPEPGTVVNIREVNWSNVRFVTRPGV